jgi:hypothetical protein
LSVALDKISAIPEHIGLSFLLRVSSEDFGYPDGASFSANDIMMQGDCRKVDERRASFVELFVS